MDALPVLLQLVRWNLVRLHQVRIRVTVAARLGNVCWIHGAGRIFHPDNTVIAVTANAGRRIGIALRDTFAVNTGGILGLLVHAERGIELVTSMRSSRPLNVHPGEIRQVFSNLISNALDAIGSIGGRLQVRCIDAKDHRSQMSGVRFLFSDSGVGISDDAYPKIFEAFYSTKNSRGSGVGLWLSAEVIGKHQGNIRVRTRNKGPHRGTLFDVFLPYSPGSTDTVPPDGQGIEKDNRINSK